MAFPPDLVDLHVEAYLQPEGADAPDWVNIDARLFQDQTVDLHHGLTDEASTFEACSVDLLLNNVDGWLTPDDPRSPWYRSWGRNCQVRLLIGDLVILHGEVSDLELQWPDGDLIDLAQVQITVSGILRRLTQGNNILRSPIYRAVLRNIAHVTDYWPMEEGTDSSQFASAKGGAPMSQIGMSFATDTSVGGAEALPAVQNGGNGTWSAGVVGNSGNWTMDVFVHLADAITANDSTVDVTVYTTGSHATWRVVLAAIDGIPYVWIRSFDSAGNTLTEQFVIDPRLLTGLPIQMRLKVVTSGSGIDWSIVWGHVSPVTDSLEGVGALASGTAGRPFFVRTNVNNAPGGGAAFGHVVFADGSLPFNWLVGPDCGWAGERAYDRMVRLSTEENIFCSFTGASDKTALLGVQRPGTFLDLMQEAADSSQMILCETRTVFGLQVRTLKSRYNQAVAWTLDAAANEIDDPFAPVDDDQLIRNHIAASRIDGGKAERLDTLSAAGPPAGDGQYDDAPSLSLLSDAQLPDQAGWHLHLGTWYSKTRDLPAGARFRYPQLTMDLGKAPSLITEWLARRVGHRIQVLNPPAEHPNEGPLDLVIMGWTETITPTTWVVTLVCLPVGPWQVATWLQSRYCANHRATLNAAIDATQTTFDVVTTGTSLWTTVSARFPLQVRVGGVELMTVTNIGAASGRVQTFTVTRNVNNFGRAHPAGSSVNLWPESILSL